MSTLVPPHGSPTLKPLLLEGAECEAELQKAEGLKKVPMSTRETSDLIMMGMPSPTVDRLNSLGLWRTTNLIEREMRQAMTRGNRLYLSQPDSTLAEPPWSGTLARSGWSWGCTSTWPL